MIKKLLEKNWRNLLMITLIVSILPFAINAAFANPLTDDYYYSYLARDRGLLDAFFYYYTHFNGRYLSIFLLLINPLTFGLFWAYKLIPLILILLMIAAIMSLISEITKGSVSFRDRLLFTMSFLLVYYDQMPDIRPGLYWMSGSITYQAGTILLILFFSVITRIRQEPIAKHCLIRGVTLILALCLPGTNEVILSLLLPSLALLFCFDYNKRKKPDIFLLSTLAMAFIGASFALFTPSNMIRISNYEGSRNTLAALEKAFDATVASIPLWIGTPLVLVLSAFVVAAICKNPQLRARMKCINPIISFSLFILFIFGTYFTPYWGMGLHPPRRVLNLIYILFLVGWLANTAIISAYLQEGIMTVAKKIPGKFIVPAFAIYVFATLGLGHSNLVLISKDLFTGTSYRYDQELQQRYAYMKQDSSPHCSVKMLENTPKSLFFGNINFTRGGWVNQSYADYFGKKTIQLQRPKGYFGKNSSTD